MTARLIETSIAILAPSEDVWRVLTDPALMTQWMAEPEMRLEIDTNWQVGSPIVMRGRHHVRFEDRGIIRRFEPYSLLEYTHLSSVSRLPDLPENYTTLAFHLAPAGDYTVLTLRISNFPTEAIFKHFDFYWRTTMLVLKRHIEDAAPGKTTPADR